MPNLNLCISNAEWLNKCEQYADEYGVSSSNRNAILEEALQSWKGLHVIAEGINLFSK